MRTYIKLSVVFYLLCGITESAVGQILTLGPYIRSGSDTRCVSGLEAGDTVLFYGTLDVTGVDIGTGINQFAEKFNLETKADQQLVRSTVCSISVYASNCGKATFNPECYCQYARGNVLHYIVRFRVDTSRSDHKIRAEWPKNDISEDPIISEEQWMPTVYELNTNSLFVRGETISLANGSLPLSRGQEYTIKWCAKRLVHPITVEVFLQGTQLYGLTVECVDVPLVTENEFAGKTLTFTYKEITGCQRKGTVKKEILLYNTEPPMSTPMPQQCAQPHSNTAQIGANKTLAAVCFVMLLSYIIYF